MDAIVYNIEEVLNIFLDKGKKIEGIFDLLLRGSGIESHTPDWSDLDLSVILEKINLQTIDEVRKIYNEIKLLFPGKVSITLVTKSDFLNDWHHHGIKPIYYSLVLQRNRSLLKGKCYLRKINNDQIKKDCIANISYLIHDLRQKYISKDEKDLSNIDFCTHLIKRTKHIIRNSIFILEDIIDEEINEELFKKHFPFIDDSFVTNLAFYKKNWSFFTKDYQQIEKIISYIFPMVEKIYEEMLQIIKNRNFY